MATGEVNRVCVNIGAISNETRPLFTAPSVANGGGLTVLAAKAVMGAGGTVASSLAIVKGTINAGGTFVVNGTIAAAIGGTAAPFLGANVTKTFTIGSSPFVSAGETVAVVEGNVQAGVVVTIVEVQYVQGR